MPSTNRSSPETPRARQRRLLAEAVRAAASKIAGGALAVTREVIRNTNGQPVEAPVRILRAMQALAIIDTQRALQRPREHGVKPHRTRCPRTPKDR